MKTKEKVRAATTEELAEMPKSMRSAYQQGRLIVKAVKAHSFQTYDNHSGQTSTTKLKIGDYWTFWKDFWKEDALVVLTARFQWYWDKEGIS